MAAIRIECNHCKFEFPYDPEIGLNEKYFQSQSTITYFNPGGTGPCCPNCNKRTRILGKTVSESEQERDRPKYRHEYNFMTPGYTRMRVNTDPPVTEQKKLK